MGALGLGESSARASRLVAVACLCGRVGLGHRVRGELLASVAASGACGGATSLQDGVRARGGLIGRGGACGPQLGLGLGLP